MPPRRRLLALLGLAAGPGRNARAAAPAVRRGRVLQFPRDHGAHRSAGTEWWYATGWLGTPAAPTHGFQLTFFRSRTGRAEGLPGRFAARQLLFGHAAVTDLAARRHLHAQRIVRWSGEDDSALAFASSTDTGLRLARWRLRRDGSGYDAMLPGDDFSLALRLAPTQPLLLQGESGWSRKGAAEAEASHYYSLPQLEVGGTLDLDGRRLPARGRAWLDHEWSDAYLSPQAVGWDWIGMNLFDGSALMAFVIRGADGHPLWAGGSHRRAGAPGAAFAPGEVRFVPLRHWTSPDSQARYPVEAAVHTPAGRFTVRALMDEQELDSRGSTGAIYWEGLSELLDAQARRVGLGYLELTGYAGRLRMGAGAR